MPKAAASRELAIPTQVAAKIVTRGVGAYTLSAMKQYGSYVVMERATADARDGLKPVQRRILWAMHELGLSSNKAPKKSAKVVGETMGSYHPHGDCLAGDTVFYGLDGTFPTIEELYEKGTKSLDVLSYNEKEGTFVAAKAHSFRVGQKAELTYVLTLSDGSKIEATSNHPFYVRGEGWVKTEDLEVGHPLEGGCLMLEEGGRPTFTSPSRTATLVQYLARPECLDPKAEGMCVHHKNHDVQDNRPKNLELLTRSEHNAEHGNDPSHAAGRAKTHERMFAEDSPIRDAIREKNSRMMSNYNRNLPLIKAIKIVKAVQADGKKPTARLYNQYRERVYNGTRLETLEAKGVSFESLVAQVDTFKLDNSNAVGLTWEIQEKERAEREEAKANEPKKEASKRGVRRLAQARAATVLEVAFTKYGRLTEKTYNRARKSLIERDGLGWGNIHGRTWPRVEKVLEKFGSFERVLQRRGPGHALFVTGIELVKHKNPKPMYDFTVDGFENALIATTDGSSRYTTLVVAHNSAIYGTLVNMVHDRYPLVEGHGNFGNDSGDPAAAYRYTEARLSAFGEAILEEVHVVDMVANYSGDRKEPLMLPARVPILLANGSEGIAVGISACIPAHNLGELIDATIALVHRPELSTKALTKRILGPDYGANQGVLLSSEDEVLALYATGRGTMKYRCAYELGKDHRGRNIITIKSLAPRFDLEKFLEKMNDLQRDGLIEEWDNSSNAENGIHVEIAYKDVRVLEQRVLPQIHTSKTYQFYTVLRDGEETLNEKTLRFCPLRDLLLEFIAFRRVIETKRLDHLLGIARRAFKKAKAILAVVSNLEKFFAILKKDGLKDYAALRHAVMKAFTFDEESADFVLHEQAHRLARLNLGDMRTAMDGFLAQIKGHKADLNDIDGVVIKRLNEMRKFGDRRGMKVRVDGAAIAGKAKPGIVVARKNGTVLRCDGDVVPPEGRVPYDYAVKTGERALCITSDNRATNFFTAYASEAKMKRVVGIAKDTDVAVAAVDESGKGITFRGDVRTSKFDVLKAPKGDLVSATGLGEKDILVCMTAEGDGLLVAPADRKVTRPGVLPFALSGIEGVTNQLMRLPVGAILVNGYKPILPKKNGSFIFNTDLPVWVVGKSNYAHIGKEKGVFTQEQVVAALKKGTVTHIVCIA